MNAPVALASAAFGWFLNEYSHYRRTRAESRAALGRALAELLEIRHYVRAVFSGFEIIRDSLGVPATYSATAVGLIQNLLPPDPGLPQRFEKAVTEVGAVAPVLAFRPRFRPARLIQSAAFLILNPPFPPGAVFFEKGGASTNFQQAAEC